jgi:tetraacyldisaccharide-1-P 4'-kinase
LKVIQSRNVLIFSSIANPAVFYQTIKKLNPNNIEEIKFSDHHVYTNEEILEIKEKAESYDYVLTTEKDIVKIDENIENLLILKMEFKIIEK